MTLGRLLLVPLSHLRAKRVSKVAGRGQCNFFPYPPGALLQLPEKKTKRFCQQLLGTPGFEPNV